MRGIDRQLCLLLKWGMLGLLFLSSIFFLAAGAASPKNLQGNPEGTKVSIQLLEEQLDQLAGDARETAGRLGKSALPALLPRTRGESVRERVLVLECLAEVKGPEAVRALVQALQDSEQDVWNMALNLLHYTNSPEAIGPLTELMVQSPHARVRGEIARILGRMEAASALPAIQSQIGKEGDQEAAHKMNLAIARLKDGDERKKVVERLSHSDPKVRYRAIGELEYVNDRNLVNRLLPLFYDEARVVNVGQERWPVWHRVCDRAVEAVVFLTGKTLPFPTGNRSYTPEQIRMARELITTIGK